jgi:hypothetical protein
MSCSIPTTTASNGGGIGSTDLSINEVKTDPERGLAPETQHHGFDAEKLAVDVPVVEPAYSVYTRKEKWLIVAMVALAGFYR